MIDGGSASKDDIENDCDKFQHIIRVAVPLSLSQFLCSDGGDRLSSIYLR